MIWSLPPGVSLDRRNAQLAAIVVTVVLAAVTGLVSGKIILILGRRTQPYVDAEEFDGESDEEGLFVTPFVKTAELEAD